MEIKCKTKVKEKKKKHWNEGVQFLCKLIVSVPSEKHYSRADIAWELTSYSSVSDHAVILTKFHPATAVQKAKPALFTWVTGCVCNSRAVWAKLPMAVSTEMGSMRRSCLQKSQIVKMLTAAHIALRPPHCWELVSCALTWKLQETSCLRTFFLWLLQIEVKNSHGSVINLVVLHAKLAFTKLSNARRELQSYPC